MTTPQEIREKSFDKARSMFGGYDMATIDEYLEELANDFEALQKENVVLKSKMKVLVDKIEEYRTNESALNQAILSAQKLSVQIENDARTRCGTAGQYRRQDRPGGIPSSGCQAQLGKIL